MAALSSNIPKIYLFHFFRNWVFWLPTAVLFWQQNGLNLTQIMLLQSIFAISIVLFEVPTGVVADKVGRKQSLVLGSLTLVIAYSVYASGYGFWQFAAAEALCGIGRCFISGADSAFIYDTLKQLGREDDFKKVRGNAQSLVYLAAAITAVIGGFVAAYSIRMTWWLGVAGQLLLFLTALTFIEPKHYRSAARAESYVAHTLKSFSASFTNRRLLFLLLFTALVAVFAKVALWFYQPYMAAAGLPLAYFGIVWASFNLSAIAGSKFAHKLEGLLGERWSLWLIIAALSGGLVAMGSIFALPGIAFILVQQFSRGFYPPVLESYTHKHLTQARRATLLSIQSMSGSLLFVVLAPLFGYIADYYSLSAALLVTGAACLGAFLLLMFWNSISNNSRVATKRKGL